MGQHVFNTLKEEEDFVQGTWMPSILYMCAILHTILKYCKTKASPKLNFLLFAIFVFYWDQAFHAQQFLVESTFKFYEVNVVKQGWL